MSDPNYSAVYDCIGYVFANPKLLSVAFTHSSYVNEHNAVDNERLEFLGDCVLNFLVGERLFAQDPTASEGRLSSRRAALVSRAPLARLVDKLNLMQFLRVGAGVDKAAFSEKARSDVFEATVGAVYLDGGLDACRKLLDKIYYPFVSPERDFKSELQAFAVSKAWDIEYNTETCDGGGFSSTVTVNNDRFCGKGRSKRAAEAEAARAAVERLIR